MFPLLKNPRKGSSPLLRDISSVISGRRELFASFILLLFVSSFFPLEESQAANTPVLWGTADYDELDGSFNTPLEFYGLNAAGASAAKLAKDIYNAGTATQVDTKGDLVELGYFASDAAGTPSAVSGDLFRGKYWIPLTSTTRIGMQSEGPDATENAIGRILPVQTNFISGNNDAVTNAVSGYIRTDTNPSAGPSYSSATLSDIIAKLDTADGSGDAFLAMRFYDINPASSTGGDQSDLASGTSRYNTITNALWKWKATNNTPQTVTMLINDPSNSNSPTGYDMELDSDDYSAVKIGSGNTLGTGDSDTVRTATITYRAGALTLASDTIVSNLDNVVSTANITGDAGTAYDLTVLAPSAGADASTDYTYSGVISNKTNIHKVGAGTQEFTGAINTTGILSIDEAALILKPGNITQSFEYLTDDGTPGTLAIDNSGGANHVVELGFASTTTAQTFAGAITLSDSGTNTLKVGGVTASDFDDHQKFTGIIGDDGSGATLKKTGSGKLTLSGDNTFTGGITIADGGGATDGGIVVAGHADALGAGTTTIEHGKLSVAGGITVANAIAGQGTNDNTDMKSVIGGGVGNSVGTITNAGNILNIGSGNNEVDVVSPGIAHASSMSNGTSDYQVIGGNKNDAGAVAVANSIGTMKINTLGLKAGGVFDWEIRDFEGGNGAGADWDVLQFDALTLGAKSDRFAINIYGVAPDGSAGMQDFSVSAAGSKNLLNKTGSFAFLTGGTVDWNGASGGNGSQWSDTEIDDYFVINADAFHYSNSYWGNGGWGVSYSGGNFILGYSAVPEPSTYVMVTGLLMLPGFQFLRRFRKRKNKGEE
jgi:autotransporter-associated beta strand protein